MKYQVHISKKSAMMLVTAAAIVVATGRLLESGRSHGQATNANTPPESGAKPNTSRSETALDLSPSQLNSIKIEPVGSYLFPVEKEAVGNIDYDEARQRGPVLEVRGFSLRWGEEPRTYKTGPRFLISTAVPL